MLRFKSIPRITCCYDMLQEVEESCRDTYWKLCKESTTFQHISKFQNVKTRIMQLYHHCHIHDHKRKQLTKNCKSALKKKWQCYSSKHHHNKVLHCLRAITKIQDNQFHHWLIKSMRLKHPADRLNYLQLPVRSFSLMVIGKYMF